MPPLEGLVGLDSSLPFSGEPLDHVFLVIPGAGDPYVDHQPWLSSLENSLSRLQKNYNLVITELEKMLRTTSTRGKLPNALFLPLEWHRAAFETWQGEVRCADPRPNTTGTITVRDAVADTLGDIIMMSSPFWRRSIAEHLATQIQSQLAAVYRNRPAFSGRVSLLAHSVGCTLAVELLHRELLPVPVDAVVLTGCPIPAYATLAPDQQPALATLRKLRSQIRFINVFHPLDPIAYRLEPFLGAENEAVQPAVKVAARRRSFWQDAELFWDDVVYNLWSTLFPRWREGGVDDETGNTSGQNDVADLFASFGGNTHGKARLGTGGERTRKRMMHRASSYVLPVEHGGGHVDNEDAPAGGEVLLSGRVDYELQDGMGVPPLDVMASWGAIKAHTYYWQSLDVAQMLLDIVVTSDDAIASRES